MRFIHFNEDIIYALCDFCEKLNENPNVQDYDILNMLYSAAEEFEKIGGVLPVTEIYRYHISGKYSKAILPEDTEKNGLIYDNVVHLGTFCISEFDNEDISGHDVKCGYDVVYDIENKTVRLLYRVEITNEARSTLYRVEDDSFEMFETADFLVGLSIQLAEKLRDGREYLGKVCDYPCA